MRAIAQTSFEELLTDRAASTRRPRRNRPEPGVLSTQMAGVPAHAQALRQVGTADEFFRSADTKIRILTTRRGDAPSPNDTYIAAATYGFGNQLDEPEPQGVSSDPTSSTAVLILFRSETRRYLKQHATCARATAPETGAPESNEGMAGWRTAVASQNREENGCTRLSGR
jgi:hypothetical protein